MSQEQHKTLTLRAKAAQPPSEQQLSAIRSLTLRDFTGEEVVVREYDLAHNCIDRDNECFDDALLDDFARTIVGKGVFIQGHPGGWRGDGAPGDGRVFAASVESMPLEQARLRLREPSLTLPPDRSMVRVLKTQTYFANTPADQAFHTKTDLGIVGDVSIGFTSADVERVKNGDGIELNVFRHTGPGEALEQSYVWLGAQPGARGTKAAGRSQDNPEDDQMDQQQKDKLNQATKDLEAAQPKAAKFDALKSALGDDAALADTPDALVALAKAGKQHRDDLVETIVKSERLSGALGDDETAVNEVRKEYSGLPLRMLKAMAGKVDAAGAAAGAATIKGSDPNPTKSAPGDAAADAAKTPAMFSSAAL